MISPESIRNIRTRRNLTQQLLAENMGVPLKLWQEIENGERELTPGTFNKLVTALEIDDDEIPSWKQMTVGNMGVKIRALRKKFNYSLEELGILSDLSPGYISEIERGEKIASFSALRAITEVFQVPVSLFIGTKRKQSIVGEKLRIARKIKMLSQKQLAEKAGVSAAMIAHLETGKVQASLDTIEKISVALGISICYLILEQEEVDEMIGAITPEMREILFNPQVQNIIGSICTFSREEMLMALNYIHMIRDPFVK